MLHAIVIVVALALNGILVFLFQRERPDIYLRRVANSRKGIFRYATYGIWFATWSIAVTAAINLALVLAGGIIIGITSLLAAPASAQSAPQVAPQSTAQVAPHDVVNSPTVDDCRKHAIQFQSDERIPVVSTYMVLADSRTEFHNCRTVDTQFVRVYVLLNLTIENELRWRLERYLQRHAIAKQFMEEDEAGAR